ncbi:SEL1-like repeat protein [Curvivirga aplysinae]|uniref:hypothetical protein n=1 Tax=Curvivirga aplysinae TaxID=2529852 RepID=UPI0012BCED29|nr:hypothetical protein [Curvivirga aplysinae]MTI08614.1 hypothetical protein [Curvivirga aplysinae]
MKMFVGIVGVFFVIASLIFASYYSSYTSELKAENIQNADTAYALGVKYRSHFFVYQDNAKAYEYFNRAYHLGHKEAANEWIFLREYGLGGTLTCEEKIETSLNILSQQNSVNAHYVLGRNYAKKDCPLFDLELAEYHLLIAGEEDHFIAKAFLIHFYFELKNDLVKQEHWERKLRTEEPISELEVWFGRIKNILRWTIGLKEQF